VGGGGEVGLLLGPGAAGFTRSTAVLVVTVALEVPFLTEKATLSACTVFVLLRGALNEPFQTLLVPWRVSTPEEVVTPEIATGCPVTDVAAPPPAVTVTVTATLGVVLAVLVGVGLGVNE